MMTDDDLNDLFAAAKAQSLQPPADLAARVLADADDVLVEMSRPVAPSRHKPNLWTKLSAVLGGGGAMAGMVTATLAGFYIGFAQPKTSGFVPLVLGGEIAELDMMPGIDALLEEVP